MPRTGAKPHTSMWKSSKGLLTDTCLENKGKLWDLVVAHVTKIS